MIVESTRFGSLETSADKAIDFGTGLLGFPDSRFYYVVEIPDEDQYLWLQSGELPELAFLVTRPWAFFPDYEIDLPDDVQEQIGLLDPTDSEVFLLLTVHRDDDPEDEPSSSITANLLGPIVVNTKTRLACQMVLDESDYGTRHPLVAAA